MRTRTDLLIDLHNARTRVLRATGNGTQSRPPSLPERLRSGSGDLISEHHLTGPVDVVVTPYEVNESHGSGILLMRIFSDSSSIVSIRTTSGHDGRQSFGAVRFSLPHVDAPRDEIFSAVTGWLRGAQVKRVVCNPYLPGDAITAIAVKEVFDVPLCTYIMDDQNVIASAIPDAAMQELLSKSSLRLVISPEMRDAYEDKYHLKCSVLPPLVAPELIQTEPIPTASDLRGVIIGNIWGQRWLTVLADALRHSGHEIDWFCNSKNPDFLTLERADLERDGIRMRDPIPQDGLARALKEYGFAIVPSGGLDDESAPALQAIAKLSLPSKIPFILATSHLPILVLGHPQTAAARFVERFQIGLAAAYDVHEIRAAVRRLLSAAFNASIRARCANLARYFSAEGAGEWIWRSLDIGEPVDPKFDELFSRNPAGLF